MKKLTTLLSIVLITFSAISQESIFAIFSENGDKFTLYVDGAQINETPLPRVENIKNANEFVNFRIVFEDSKIPELKKYTSLKDLEGNHNKITFAIKEKKGKYKVRVISYEPINPGDLEAARTTYYEEPAEISEGNETETTSSYEISSNNDETSSGFGDAKVSDKNDNSEQTTASTGSMVSHSSSSSAENGSSVALKYKWTTGKTYRFQANQVDNVTMSVMGMNQTDVYTTNSTFSLKVSNVLANGTAEGFLYVEDFKVTSSSGATIASLNDIPDEALKSLVEVDTKGKFTFKKIVYMVVNGDSGNILVSANAKDGKVSGSAQVGDQKMSIHAEFDPKSGTIKAGYSMETVKKPAPKTVKVKEDAQRIDVLPLQFLDMLVLPEGNVYTGSSFTTKMMEYAFTTNTKEISNNMATLDLNIKTDRSEGSSSNMGASEMNTTGMSMDMGAMGAPETNINGDISYMFDIENGIFNELKGTLTNSINGMGLDLKVKSNLKMNLVK